MVRCAVGMAGLHLMPLFLAGADAEGENQEEAQHQEQEIDGGDRAPLHRQTLTMRTSTTGFLPVQSVAQRRTARRMPSRSLDSLPLFFWAASAAASQASSRNASRSSSTGKIGRASCRERVCQYV